MYNKGRGSNTGGDRQRPRFSDKLNHYKAKIKTPIAKWSGADIYEFCEGEEDNLRSATKTKLRKLFSILKQTHGDREKLEVARIQLVYDHNRDPKKGQPSILMHALIDNFLSWGREKSDEELKDAFNKKFIKILEGLVAFGPQKEG